MAAEKEREASAIDIAELDTLGLPELQALWQRHFPAHPPRRMSRELMMRAIAYRLQEQHFGGLSRQAKAKLKAYSTGPLSDVGGRAATPKISVKPGTQLVRQWRGQMHTVIALEDGGFDYRDKRYRTLSQIAHHITGTKWSGPAFFGLKTVADASIDDNSDHAGERP